MRGSQYTASTTVSHATFAAWASGVKVSRSRPGSSCKDGVIRAGRELPGALKLQLAGCAAERVAHGSQGVGSA
jgi:hypothetical protein